MHIIHATIASTGFRLVRWFCSSLGNSWCRFRVIHVAFSPDFGIEVFDLVLIQTDILDILPEGVVVAGSIESCKISWGFGGLCSWLSCSVWDIGLIWIESINTSKDGGVLFLNSFPLLILNVFHRWAEGILCLKSCRRLHECCSIRALHFDTSCSCHARFGDSRLIMGAINIWRNLVGAHIFLASLLWHRCCLAKSSDGSTHFWRSKPVSWVLLANCRFDTGIVITLAWSHLTPGPLSKT